MVLKRDITKDKKVPDRPAQTKMTETGTFTDLEPNPRRNIITELVLAHNYDGLRKMGIEVIEKEGNPNECCYEAAFPSSIYPRDILSKVISTWEITDSPKVEDVAVYFNTSSKAMTHVGQIIENGKVRSRWGSGGMLCEHLPLDVTIFLGKELEIIYFREPK